MHSERLTETRLPKRIALPVFASDVLSSVAYAPDEIFLTLAFAGVAALSYSAWIGLGVVFVMLIVVASYRQNVHAYPSGGGDYEVATTNLGGRSGLTVASDLLVDYVLTVAVSVSSAQYAAAAIPSLRGHEAIAAVIVVIILMTMNLRGVRESGTAFAIPTYTFMVAIVGMGAFGLIRWALGDLPLAESAGLTTARLPEFDQGLTGLAWGFLLLRAFSSGCAALTGVEAISNGVPAFKVPKSKNAATTLALLGGIAVTMLMSILVLGNLMHVRYAEKPATQLLRDGKPVGVDYVQDPIIGQIAKALFAGFPPAFYLVAATTGLILVLLAANTAFNGFPVLGFVGVSISFTTSQTGMVRHRTRLLRTETDPARRRHMQRSRVVNSVGLTITGLVLVIVLVTKFVRGAYLALAAMALLYLLMLGIRRHYQAVRRELEGGERYESRASRPSLLESITVTVDAEDTEQLRREWDARDIPVPLRALESPYREITGPVVDYVKSIRRESPRDLVVVDVPEYVVGHWWEQVLHNQSALRLKARLHYTPGTERETEIEKAEIEKAELAEAGRS